MRKILLAIVGLVNLVFGLFGVQLGIVDKVQAASLIGAILIIGAYLFTEFKKDFADFKNNVIQTNKWSDPSFWVALLAGIGNLLSQYFGITISESIVSLLAAVLAILVPFILSLVRKTEPAQGQR